MKANSLQKALKAQGFPAPSVNRWVNGKGRPNRRQANRLAKLLGLEPSIFMVDNLSEIQTALHSPEVLARLGLRKGVDKVTTGPKRADP
jgi:SOS-response transcriptional repressor LexA